MYWNSTFQSRIGAALLAIGVVLLPASQARATDCNGLPPLPGDACPFPCPIGQKYILRADGSFSCGATCPAGSQLKREQEVDQNYPYSNVYKCTDCGGVPYNADGTCPFPCPTGQHFITQDGSTGTCSFCSGDTVLVREQNVLPAYPYSAVYACMPCPTGSKRSHGSGDNNFCIYPPPGANFCPKGSEVTFNVPPQGGTWTEASMVASYGCRQCPAGLYEQVGSVNYEPYGAVMEQGCVTCPKGSTSSAGQTACKCPAGSIFVPRSGNPSTGYTPPACKLAAGVQGTENQKREKPTKKTGGTMAPELDLPGASSGSEPGRPGLTTGGRKP
jgi:hypothetical protein